ncbi:expansin EXLX1 family cellulose-binding protein [Micromonospora sp. WMMD1155]|uniref:expansin EXLX1 family cellulose-binding protein n=1 Tax=Micromonospora sp. WMMD1155 TaxID=3016094 RepID=UPI00249B99A5|nr:expansin EXLX1 family cellulose-binding protein [Micromonospora sp. WMMD1155]WFE52510.1 expansin EXLX1 family cellulose-binding protein [Micromonospora sp. WMMD1155]
MTAPGTDPENDTPASTPRMSRRTRHWLVGAGLTALAATLGITLAVRGGATPACAAPPSGNTVHKGKASFYDAGRSGGNCSFPGPPADRLYVALGSSQYSKGAACGSYLDVTGPKGTVRVMVMDQCGGCGPTKIDLSTEAFTRIADRSQGIASVTYRAALNPPLDGGLTFRIKGGASQWWFAVQVGNHGNPLRSVEAKGTSGGFRKAIRQTDNYWTVEGGLGPGPFSIKVTDVYGHRATATGIRMVTKQVQRSTVSLVSPATPSSSPSPSPPASPSAPSSPSAAPPSPAPTATVEALAGPAPLGSARC